MNEEQVAAIMEAYTTLRAGYYAMREHFPEVAATFAVSASDLLLTFPVLVKFEEFIRLGETELAKGGTDGEKEGEEGQRTRLS